MTSTTCLDTALLARKLGFSPVPPKEDGSKAPIGEWKEYQKTPASTQVIRAWYRDGRTGNGLACGVGNLECFEFDDAGTFNAFLEAAWSLGLGELVNRIRAGYEESTPGGGVHWLYRCDTIGGNTKLACRHKTPEEFTDSDRKAIETAAAADKEHKPVKTLIETRGRGGFVITAPSNGKVHPTGGVYKLVTGGLESIATISREERDALWRLARTFDQMPAAKPSRVEPKTSAADSKTPGDDFEERSTWADILEPFGWEVAHTSGDVTYWRRPGKDEGWSATTGYCKGLKVFSSSTPFSTEGTHSKFSVYTILNHGGDYTAAARALAEKGYGRPLWAWRGNAHGVGTPSSSTVDPSTQANSVGITDDKPFDPDSIKWNGGPKPVRTELLAVPTMPDDLIPDPLRPWLFDIAERVSCPVDFAVIPALVALGVVLGRKIGMRPKEHDVWTVIPNPWGALIGRPGVLKTPPLKEALSPLRRLELDAKVVFEREQAQYENQLLLKDIEQKVAKAEIQEAIRSKKSKYHIEKLASELADIITPDAPKQRRYTTSDITMEALGVLIRDHGHIAILRDELMGWFKNLERSEQGTAKALYLELYDGVGELFNFDRIGRGNIALTGGTGQILGGIQPGPWHSFLRAIRLDCAADDGLISRMSLLVWPDVTEWRNVDRWPDTTAKNAAFEIYEKLANLAPDAVGAKQDEYGSKMPFLHFDNKAQELFNLWRNNLETRLRTNEESPQLESHLAKYRKLMPQMAFMSHLVQVVMDGQSGPVTFKHAERGLRWCEYMEHHARRAYAGGGDQDIEPPQALAAKIKAGMVPSPFTHRDVYRHCWTNLDTPQLAGGAIAFLVDRGWLFIAENIQTGGAPRADIYIHPSLPRRVPENENTLGES